MNPPDDGMRNASERPPPHGFTCASCGTFTVTAVDGLFSNPRVGSQQRFCAPACRVAAWRRRRAGVAEDTARQPNGGRARCLNPADERPGDAPPEDRP